MRLGFMAASAVVVGAIGWLSAASTVVAPAVTPTAADRHLQIEAPPAVPGISVPEPLRGPTLRTSALAAADRAAAATVPGAPALPVLPNTLGPAVQIVAGSAGIPQLVLEAYRAAEARLATDLPGCHLPWYLLAGIGRIESGHAGGGRTDVNGTTMTAILGPRLNGTLAGNAVIGDTDGGSIDGDPHFDRAVGPMQFLPGTWKAYAADGNGDGRADPNNVFDAALGAGKYLCAGAFDMRNAGQRMSAILRYNNSGAYAAQVLTWAAAYSQGATPTPGQLSTAMAQPIPVAPGPESTTAPGAVTLDPVTLAALAATTEPSAPETTDGAAPSSTPRAGAPEQHPIEALAQSARQQGLESHFNDIRGALEGLAGVPAPADQAPATVPPSPAPAPEQPAVPVDTTAPAPAITPIPAPAPAAPAPAPAPVEPAPEPQCRPNETPLDALPEPDRARLSFLPLGPCVDHMVLQVAGIPIPPVDPTDHAG